MINRVFFEGRCLVEKRGNAVYNDNVKGKLPIFVGTFLNTTRNRKLYKTFLFLGDLAVYAKQNFTKNKFFILEACFGKIKGVSYIKDKDDLNVGVCLKGDYLVVLKIYRSYRTYANEETTEFEKSIIKRNNHTYKTNDWEMLAKKNPIKILRKRMVNEALEKLGIYELDS